ncbi:hypothetical protein [Pseudomonas sp. KU43P]|uniref:hypothetical protein n=1 Tax=Pseudomonas sp. KU43P TaxID=2487887 RepID=UPI0012A9B1C0|nr:hypothetical protein [Pseudomonas sp. KU43P]BBH46681.1 hypothetical protein KU43P_31580 [Pseudomonas sp. KU43P]
MSDIGTSGELHFMALCAGDGITVNKSQTDKNGWDVLIEIDQLPTALTQQTLHEPVITGTVQIKSTRSKSLKVSVTLSNLRKMATSSLPTFYLLMDFTQGPVPSRAFLRHVDEPLIRQILERVNTHLVAGKGEKLHKLTMVVDFSSGQEIALDGSASLRSEFLRIVGSSQARYTDGKQRFLKSVGYEDGSHLMRFNLVGHENLQAMINATLGRGGPIELQDMQIFSKRFGLEDPSSRHHAPVGTLVIEPSAPNALGTLTLRSGATGESVQVDAAAYVSPLHSMLPLSAFQIRVDCGLFEWYVKADGSGAKFASTLDPEAPVPLENLCTYLQVIDLMAKPQGLSIEMDFNGARSQFTVTGGPGFPGFPDVLQVAEALLKTKVAFRDRGLLEVSVAELIQSSQVIQPFFALLNKEISAWLTFSVDGKTEPFECVCLAPLELSIGEKHYLTILAVTGKTNLLPDGRFSIATTNFDTIYKTVLRTHERTADATILQLQRVVDEYTHSLPIVSLFSTIAADGLNQPLATSRLRST